MNIIQRNASAFARAILDDVKESAVKLYTGQRVNYKPKGKRYSVPCYVWVIDEHAQKAIVKRMDTGKTLTVSFAELQAVK